MARAADSGELVDGWELAEGWELVATPPGAHEQPIGMDGLGWQPARVPGTAAGAVGVLDRDFDAEDWWFRVRFRAPTAAPSEQLVLALEGIATVADVYLNGELVLHSESMWDRHEVALGGLLRDDNELAIACRALAPLMSVRRRPAARWRTRVVNEGNLRWYRTMVFGRSPGFAPGPAPVGPWRPVRVVRGGGLDLRSLSIRPRLEGDDGVVALKVRTDGAPGAVRAAIGGHHAELRAAGGDLLSGELRVPSPGRWWPHTHGEPTLHELTLSVGEEPVATRRVGFRSLSWPGEIVEDGLDLHVNGVPVFARGAVWTPADLITMAPSPDDLRRLLELVRDAGMNMLRVVGTGAYEPALFHDLCDELGILVWQDLMFANLDYPVADPGFRAVVEQEARALCRQLVGRPSLAVLCGNSEVEQQPAMMGLDPTLGRDQLWDEALPAIVSDAGLDCAYVRSTPCGGDLPFHVNRGLGHYFGVSGYFGSSDDARRAGVRFASECLAFANVPDRVDFPVHHPDWKRGVARDAGTGWDLGAGWDFDDVRDFYVRQLFGVDPVQLRRSEHARYLDLSRAASGEVMAEVIGEWRRASSPCRGALVLWLKDMHPGAGLGVIDAAGAPKVAYHYLRRAFAPIAIWMVDERVNGVAIHIANDGAEPLVARLRVSLYRDGEVRVDEAAEELELSGRSCVERTVEGLLGRFVDAAWAYRFGPPAAEAIFATLESSGATAGRLSQAVFFPAGRPTARETAERLGITASACERADGTVAVAVRSRRLVYAVRTRAHGFVADDDVFSLEPGVERELLLRPASADARWGGGTITALNLAGSLPLAPEAR